MEIHLVWIGPQPLTFLDLVAVLTIRSVYEIKPTFWMWDVPENEWTGRIGEHCVLPDLAEVPADMMEIADSIYHPRHRSDYLRMCLVHERGGMYCDTDIFWVKPIASFLPGELVIPQHGAGSMFGNALIYSPTSENPILSKAIEFAEEKAGKGNVEHAGHSPLGMDAINDAILWTKDPYTALAKEKLFRYFYKQGWDDFMWDRDTGDMEECVYGLHWWRCFFVTQMNSLVTPEYIRNSDALMARYLRKGLENGDWIDAL